MNTNQRYPPAPPLQLLVIIFPVFAATFKETPSKGLIVKSLAA